jgi:hypothetical protein
VKAEGDRSNCDLRPDRRPYESDRIGTARKASRRQEPGCYAFRSFRLASPVLKRAAGKHLPVELMGPEQLDNMVSDIRLSYVGPLRLAHDLMRIEL